MSPHPGLWLNTVGWDPEGPVYTGKLLLAALYWLSAELIAQRGDVEQAQALTSRCLSLAR